MAKQPSKNALPNDDHGEPQNPALPIDMAEGQTPEASGNGPGGRPFVDSHEGDGPRAPRQGDQHRPRCPRCTTEDTAALLVATSSPGEVTYYKCRKCGFAISRLKPAIERTMLNRHTPNVHSPFVARPE